MKTHFHFSSLALMSLLATLSLSSAGFCQKNAAPRRVAKKKASPALPAEVRAQLPTGILSLSLFKLAPAPGEKSYLFHLWAVPRRDPDGGPTDFAGNRPPNPKGPITPAQVNAGGLLPSPFTLDIFAPGAKAGHWEYQNSLSWYDTESPTRYALQFLDAKKKKGFALSLIRVHEGFKYDSVSEGFYTFPTGWRGVFVGPRDLGSSQDNLTSSTTSLVRGANGLLQIKEVNTSNESPNEYVQIWNWDDKKMDWELPAEPAKPTPR